MTRLCRNNFWVVVVKCAVGKGEAIADQDGRYINRRWEERTLRCR
jgi:hypothetical protein